MASRSGENVDLVAAGVAAGTERRPVREFPPEISDDAILVGAARNGDRAAFGSLYDRYAPMVHGVLLA